MLRVLSSITPLISAGDWITPSNRNRRTSGAVQWPSRSAWSEAVTGRRISRCVVRVWLTAATLPAGTGARLAMAQRPGPGANRTRPLVTAGG